jgi:hypothetical protein
MQIRSYTRLGGVENPACAHIKDLFAAFANIAKIRGTELVVRPKLTVEATDFSFDPKSGLFCLLFNRADGSLSDVTFKDFGSKKRRNGGKQKTEGIESSSHVMLKPNPDGRSALMLMSMGSGMGPGIVERLFSILQTEIKDNKKAKPVFEFKDPSGEEVDGQPVAYRVKYAFESLGYKGHSLDDALKNGAFQSMELIETKFEKFDQTGNLVIEEYVMEIKATNALVVTGGFVKNAVRRFKAANPNKKFDQLKVRYKKLDGDTATASLDPNDLDAAFTKREKIYLDTDVEAQQSILSPEILSKMKKL